MRHTRVIPVADATRAALTGLVFTAIALFGTTAPTRGTEDTFEVRFEDDSGNAIDIALDTSGRVIDISPE